MQKQEKLKVSEELANLKPIRVTLDQVFLDPNNPRLAAPGKEKVPDSRITEESVQNRCLEEMRKIVGIDDLRESIKTSGFWTVDRVVLRELKPNQYVVVEGNRRIAALKTLKQSYENGTTPELDSKILKGIEKFEALLYKGANPDIGWIIQGFRHTPGIEPWKKYPTAKFLVEFVKTSGKSITEIALIFPSIGRSTIGLLIRSYYGFEQAKEDEDFGDRLDPEKFGLFSEIIFKKPNLRDWLEWDERTRRFKNEEGLKKFLSWTTSEKKQKPKLTISPQTRDLLSELVKPENKELFERFEREVEEVKPEDFDIGKYYKEIFKEKEKRLPIDIPEIIRNLKEMEKQISILPIAHVQLEATKEQRTEILKILERLMTFIQRQIKNLKNI
uniref:ParB/Sulfiredoxin domain-containing protein n=1 Tax=candidate division WOR-3 bacterium TaxID=2052148 RepID=A0A7C3US71_UNCW3